MGWTIVARTRVEVGGEVTESAVVNSKALPEGPSVLKYGEASISITVRGRILGVHIDDSSDPMDQVSLTGSIFRDSLTVGELLSSEGLLLDKVYFAPGGSEEHKQSPIYFMVDGQPSRCVEWHEDGPPAPLLLKALADL